MASEVHSWVIMRCPTCALVYSPPEAGTVSRCYCGTQRELERVEVVPRSEVERLRAELEGVRSAVRWNTAAELEAEVESLRGLLAEACDLAEDEQTDAGSEYSFGATPTTAHRARSTKTATAPTTVSGAPASDTNA